MRHSYLLRASFITQPPAGCVRTQAPASPPPAGCVRAIPNVEAHKQRRSARLQPAKSESPAPDSLSSRGHFFDDVASFSRLREAYNTCSETGKGRALILRKPNITSGFLIHSNATSASDFAGAVGGGLMPAHTTYSDRINKSKILQSN